MTQAETEAEFKYDGEGFGAWDGSKLPDWLVRHFAPYTAEARARKLSDLYTALVAAQALQAAQAAEARLQSSTEDVRKAAAALEVAKSIMMGGGRWKNTEGHQKDEAVWIDVAIDALAAFSTTKGEK